MSDTLSFKKLSAIARDKAIRDYLKGWEETHNIEDMSYLEAFDILLDSEEDRYTIDGSYTPEEEL